MCTFLERFKKSKNAWLRALMQSDCLYSFFIEHYNRILQCYFENVCRPPRICTSPGLSLGWTLLLNMRFSCPYTLDVLLHQVLRVSKQLCQESVCNIVLHEVLRVREQVSVILWSYHQRRYKTFCLVLSICVVQIACACALRTSFLVQRSNEYQL